ncbi:COP23 domain-containing protein [Cyanobium gracile]
MPASSSRLALMLSALVAGAASVVVPHPAEARARSFLCSTIGGVPTTVAATADGRSVPVIRWTSRAFDNAGWTAARRCQDVSTRFDIYNREGRLKYLTTGRINDMPVICTTTSMGGGCDRLLYTLKPGQSASATLQNLLDVRVKARAPLVESNGRTYLSINELLDPSPVTTPAVPAVEPTGADANRLF